MASSQSPLPRGRNSSHSLNLGVAPADALSNAVLSGDAKRVEKLLQSGVSPNTIDAVRVFACPSAQHSAPLPPPPFSRHF